MPKAITRSIALLLACAFIFPDLAWTFQPDHFRLGNHPLVFQNQTVEISPKHAVVQQSFQGNGELVIHIQDLHCNAEVQLNIAQTLGWLAQRYGLQLVGVEGTSLPINTAKLRTFPIPEVREEVGRYFVNQGKLSGAEYYAATGKHPIRLEGMETQELYAANRREVDFILQDEGQGYCQDARERLEALKTTIENPELLAFNQKRFAYRTGQLGASHYAAFLLRTAEAHQLNLAAFPHFAGYVQTAEVYDTGQVFQELEAVEQMLCRSMLKTEAETELEQAEHCLDVIEKMLNISASAAEIAEFRTQPDKFSAQALITYFNQHPAQDSGAEQNGDLLGLDEYIKIADEFYRVADERSLQLTANLRDKMRTQGQKIAVLITGGYHTEAILAKLKQEGVSYLSIKPCLTQQDLVNPYFSILKNRMTPLEKMLAQNQNIFMPEPNLPTGDPAGTVDEAKLPLRQRLFSQGLELYLKLRTLVYFYLQNKTGQELARCIHQAMNGYPANSDRIDINPQQVKLHPNNILSCPFRLNHASNLLAALSLHGAAFPFADTDVAVAEIGQNRIAVANAVEAPAIYAQLEAQPAQSLAELTLLKLLGIYTFLWLTNRFARQVKTVWPEAVISVKELAGAGTHVVSGIQDLPVVKMHANFGGDEPAIRRLSVHNAILGWLMAKDEHARGRALIWIEENADTLPVQDAEAYARHLLDPKAVQQNPYRLWYALNALQSRLRPGSSLRRQVEDFLDKNSRFGKKNVKTYDGRLDPLYAFLLAYPPLRKLLEEGGVVNDIGIGGPVPSTVGLVKFLRTHGFHNRVIAADIIIPAYIIRKADNPENFAYYDEQHNMIAAYEDGIAMNRRKEDQFPRHISNFQDPDLLINSDVMDNPYQRYAHNPKYGFDLVKASYGMGVKADIKIYINVDYMDKGREENILTKLNSDLSENGYILFGTDRSFILYQKQQSRHRPLSIQRIIGKECKTISLVNKRLLFEEIGVFADQVYLKGAQSARELARYGLQSGDFGSIDLSLAEAKPSQLVDHIKKSHLIYHSLFITLVSLVLTVLAWRYHSANLAWLALSLVGIFGLDTAAKAWGLVEAGRDLEDAEERESKNPFVLAHGWLHWLLKHDGLRWANREMLVHTFDIILVIPAALWISGAALVSLLSGQTQPALNEEPTALAGAAKTTTSAPLRAEIFNRSLLGLRPMILRMVIRSFTPDFEVKASYRFFRPFNGLMLALIKMAVWFLVTLAPKGTKPVLTAGEDAKLRIRQLISADALEARGLDPAKYHIRPLSEDPRPLLARWQQGSFLGDYSLAGDKFYIYVPDALYWLPLGELEQAWRQIFFDITVWSNAMKCQEQLAAGQIKPGGDTSRRQRQRRRYQLNSVFQSA